MIELLLESSNSYSHHKDTFHFRFPSVALLSAQRHSEKFCTFPAWHPAFGTPVIRGGAYKQAAKCLVSLDLVRNSRPNIIWAKPRLAPFPTVRKHDESNRERVTEPKVQSPVPAMSLRSWLFCSSASSSAKSLFHGRSWRWNMTPKVPCLGVRDQ